MNLTVRAEELGDELRRLREAAGFSLERAGELIDASATKMSRMENGLREGSTEDIAALLAIYGCVGPHRTELLTLAREVDQRGWWQRNDYTYALMRDSELVPADEIECRVRARAHRHSILLGPKPARLLALVDEQVLTRLIGGPAVMQRQLNHLAEASALANISLRVLSNSGAHAGVNGAFTLLKRANEHKIVYLENLTSSLILEEPEEIETYEKATRLLVRRALSAGESLQVITELARRWGQGELA